MPSTSPWSASFTAISTACPATRPARMVRARSSGRSPLPSPQAPTGTRRWPGTAAIWSSAPTTVISASSGSARARAAISGPIPRGSPSVTARRGRGRPRPLGADVDVGGLAEAIQVPADGELLTELLPDLVLHVLVLDVTGGPPGSHLQHDELLASVG